VVATDLDPVRVLDRARVRERAFSDVSVGSGLRGLADRVQAVGGELDMTSPLGAGTRLRAQLPANVLGSLNRP
jgi:signal transduction histidine kinase